MADFPSDLRYLQSHEWAMLADYGTVLVGISYHAQEALGDVVYVELPELQSALVAGDEVAVVESVKAASDIYAPCGGVVIAINEALEDSPELVNESPYDKGWFFKIQPSDVSELERLLSASDYESFCENEYH